MSSIQLVNIAEEISKLWDQEQGQNKIRASLFNFILYIHKSENAQAYKEIIKSVVSKFPCRVIMIINETSAAEDSLKTTVDSETIGQLEQQIFCEMITIEVAGKLIERVPFMILPHILPDLPVYLLWTQDPTTENTILPHLERLARRIIFDSEATKNLQYFAESILSLIRRFHCTIGDLNWSALSGWRSLFYQVFNSKDSLLSLTQSKLIRIEYNKLPERNNKNPLIEAAYLQAWLASRLNWKFQSIEEIEGNVRLTYKRPLKEIVVLLKPQEKDHQPNGALLSVEIESTKEGGTYFFKRDPESRQVWIQYSEDQCCHLPYSMILKGSAEGQEILEEIFYPSDTLHYKSMLEVLSTIQWRET